MITEIETGLSYGSLSADPNFDAEIASAYNLEMAISFMYQYRFVKATVVILTKEESHNNSNIFEYKMRYSFVRPEPESENRRSNDKNAIILVN